MPMHPSATAPTASPTSPASVSLYDARPFFEKALQFGVQNGIIDREKLDAIRTDAPKGMVQIARYFGNEFLRPDLEKAKDRIVNLVSLYLQSSCGGDLRQAAESLRDHSFLSRSKGGSDLLKALLALPESTVFHASLDSGAEAGGPPKGLAEWSLKSFADYQAELARRRPLQQEKDAAIWLAGELGMDAEELEEAHTHAEAVIRTALLAMATRRTEMPDWVEFEKMVAALRKKYRAAKTRTAVQAGKTSSASARSLTLSLALPANLPDEFRDVVQAVLQSVQADLPQILDSALTVRALFANDSEDHHPPLLGRYFWVEDIASEMDHHERSVSQAWDKVTGGNCDDGSLLTLMVCVAAGAAPKTILSEKAATALVRKIQKPGAKAAFSPELARQYILEHAPVQHQDAYLQLWADFMDEAQSTLQSDSTYALKDALALLRRECHVTA
ncbi:conserved hypothetical protein [Polaromonas naphthalenivorans CJ2]|uniref:Uncharacterized protein n=1 Tax=Polaromonas naphthalenivorans (strain CJ2) TaxID=365044 RepID=A1VSC0_POLNA|nr:conserved hypothetical protein [Polaromonas naphthalenivorans CJ2]